MWVSRLKKAWKEVTLLGLWIVSLVGSFIIPLPSWFRDEQTASFYFRFVIFIASVLGVFLILHSLRNRLIKRWRFLSILFFIPLIIFFVSYSYMREELTLPYEGKDVIIGNERIANDPLTKLEKQYKGPLEKSTLMRHFQGVSERVWTEKSIKQNRLKLTLLFVLSYSFATCFIISFSNLILLYKVQFAEDSDEGGKETSKG